MNEKTNKDTVEGTESGPQTESMNPSSESAAPAIDYDKLFYTYMSSSWTLLIKNYQYRNQNPVYFSFFSTIL